MLEEYFATDLVKGADNPRKKRATTVIVHYENAEDTDDGYILHFTVQHLPANGGSGRTHRVDVSLESLKELGDMSLESLKAALVAGDIKIQCSCEDFLYKGFAYMGTQLDYSLMDEPRFPQVRNPNLEGSVCKHGISVLSKLNLFYGPIVRDIGPD